MSTSTFSISIEDVADNPPPGLARPQHICFSPLSDYLAYLHSPEHGLSRDCFLLELSTGTLVRLCPPNDSSGNTEANLSLEEKLRRERTRTFGVGITQFSFRPNVAAGLEILIPLQGHLYGLPISCPLNSSTTGEPLNVTLEAKDKMFDKSWTGASGGAIDAQYSPDGTSVAFVQESEIYVMHVNQDQSTLEGPPVIEQVTSGARETGTTNGLACFLTQEELDRYRGFWWAPNSQWIAFEHVDDTHVPGTCIIYVNICENEYVLLLTFFKTMIILMCMNPVVESLEFQIMHSGKDSVGADAQESHRYPFAGAENPKRKLGVAMRPRESSTGPSKVSWMNMSWIEDILGQTSPDNRLGYYISRVNWLPDHSLAVQILNRLQTEVLLIRFDPLTESHAVLIHETSDVWINTHDLFRALEHRSDSVEKQYFIWGSERSGYMHLYLYMYEQQEQESSSSSGKPVKLSTKTTCLGPLTSGKWIVETIEQIVQYPTTQPLTEKDDHILEGMVYITGTYDSALECHVYALPLTVLTFDDDCCRPTRVTKETGTHMACIDASSSIFVDLFSSLTCAPKMNLWKLPTSLTLRNQDEWTRVFSALQPALSNSSSSLDGSGSPHYIDSGAIDVRVEKLSPVLVTPELLSFPVKNDRDSSSSAPQVIMLHGSWYGPNPDVYGPGPYPTCVSVYGGPHVQRVRHHWPLTVDMRAQALVQRGIAVFKLDNRGSNRRGLAFEGSIKHRMGTLEILDQQQGVEYLVAQGLAIPSRVGIYGWSYGGYLSLMCLLKASETFSCAVAGAPVTSWDGYDSCYTERYMSTPQLNPRGYAEGSVMNVVHEMKDSQHLLLVHGLIDENVHFRHTARLINKLIGCRKIYDVLLFPEERHSPRHVAERIYLEERILAYIVKHL